MPRKKSERNASPNEKPVLHFLLTEDYLIAANHGQHLTKEGLRATCRAQTSPKDETKGTPIKSRKDSMACMEEIWKAWIGEYQKKPDAPARHAAAERNIGEKLESFLLREFIQNANDANSGAPLGGKGLRLRTILSICDRPRIYSGALSFCFDRHLGQKVLKESLGKINLSDTPLMRLPFPVARSREPARFRKLIETYDTIIVIPFRTKTIRAVFLPKWDDFVDDVTTLLYLPALDHIIWERDDAVETTKRTWVRDNKDRNAVRMVDEGKRAAPPRIRIRPAPRFH